MMGRGMQSDCQQTGQQFLSLQLRHQPKEAALLPMHLGGLEPCPELGMVSPEHSRTTLPLVQASKLKSVHKFMLLIYTHTHTHMHAHTSFLSLHSSFPRAAGTGGLGIGASPTAGTSDPSQIASSASTEIFSSLRYKPGSADAAEQNSEASHSKGTTGEHIGSGLGPGHCQSGDFTCCLGTRHELWTSWSWAGLTLHQEGQARRSKEACKH